MLQKTEEEHFPTVGHDGVWIPARLPEGVPVWPTYSTEDRPMIMRDGKTYNTLKDALDDLEDGEMLILSAARRLTWGQRLWLWQYETTTRAGWVLLCVVERITDCLLQACSRLVAWLERR